MKFTPIISKILYAILVSPLQAEQSNFEHSPRTPLLKGSSYRRTISTVLFVDGMIPWVSLADRLSGLMYKNNRFPWAPVSTKLIAFGSGTAVFKIDWKGCPKVLRIYRKSLGKSAQGLLEIATHYKKNYETVLSWFGSSPGLVLPMEFLILYGLPFLSPVAASLQPFVQGKIQDLFDDFSDDQLARMFKKHALLREQFLLFAEQILKHWEEQKMCFDFLGRHNLMMVNQGGRYTLHIADVGIFDFDHIAKKYPHKREEIKQRIDRLASLYQLAKES